MKEQREAKRIATNLTVKWHTPVLSHEGKVIDLSSGGCFILTASHMPVNKLSMVKQVSKKETILIELLLSHAESLKLRAEVVYRVGLAGFAVRFLDLALHEKQVIQGFIKKQESGSLKSLPFPRVERGHKH
jgi:hypothetical protein